MKILNVRQMRAALPRLDEVVAEAGEVVVMRHGRALARILPVRSKRRIPSRKDLRVSMPKVKVPSEVLIRRDRDER